MTETTQQQGPALRALLPRIFSRSQPAGGLESLTKTVRQQHPKADRRFHRAG